MLGWHRSWTLERYLLFCYTIYVPPIEYGGLRRAGHVAGMEGGRSPFKILTGTPAGKRSLGRPRCRWEDNIRMDLKEIVISTMNWVIWLRIGITGEPLWILHWTTGFHKPWTWLIEEDSRYIRNSGEHVKVWEPWSWNNDRERKCNTDLQFRVTLYLARGQINRHGLAWHFCAVILIGWSSLQPAQLMSKMPMIPLMLFTQTQNPVISTI